MKASDAAFDAADRELTAHKGAAADFVNWNEPLLTAALRAYNTGESREAIHEMQAILKNWRESSRRVLALAAIAPVGPHRGSRA